MAERNLIAIIDDDASVRTALNGLLRSLGFANVTFVSAKDFLSSRLLPRTACVVADVNMPGMTGPELYQSLVASGTAIPVILITAYPDDRVREQALRAGVVGYFGKPFHDDDLIACLRSALACAPLGEAGS